jgi:hypothetical protein
MIRPERGPTLPRMGLQRPNSTSAQLAVTGHAGLSIAAQYSKRDELRGRATCPAVLHPGR